MRRTPEVEFMGLGLVGGEVERKWYRELNRSLWVLVSEKRRIWTADGTRLECTDAF